MPQPSSVRYYHDMDLVKNQIFNVKLHPISTVDREAMATSLTTNDEGVIVYDIDLDSLFLWNGVEWITISGGGNGFVSNVGDGVNTFYTITHNLNSKNLFVQVYENATDELVFVDITHPTVNTTDITFSAAPGPDEYRVIIKPA